MNRMSFPKSRRICVCAVLLALGLRGSSAGAGRSQAQHARSRSAGAAEQPRPGAGPGAVHRRTERSGRGSRGVPSQRLYRFRCGVHVRVSVIGWRTTGRLPGELQPGAFRSRAEGPAAGRGRTCQEHEAGNRPHARRRDRAHGRCVPGTRRGASFARAAAQGTSQRGKNSRRHARTRAGESGAGDRSDAQRIDRRARAGAHHQAGRPRRNSDASRYAT